MRPYYKKNKELEAILSEIDNLDFNKYYVEDATDFAKEYIRKRNIFNTPAFIFIFLSLIFAFYSFFEYKYINTAGALALISIFFNIFNRKLIKKSREYQIKKCFTECNTQELTILTKYYFIYTGYKGERAASFNLILSGLLYCGQRDLAEALFNKLKDFYNDSAWLAVVNSAQFSFLKYKNNPSALEFLDKEIKRLEGLNTRNKIVKNILTGHKDNYSYYKMLIDEDLEGIINHADATLSSSTYTIVKVSKAYHGYKAAMKLGDTDKADVFKDYVIKNGGTTFFRDELIQETAFAHQPSRQ